MDFESIPGEGTAFHFSLPARHGTPFQEPTLEPTPRLQGRRILVMDDDEAVRDVLRAFLARVGHEVVATGEGLEAVRQYREAQQKGNPFDLVILDLTVVEGQGGTETIRQLLDLDPEANVLVSSGYSQDPVMSDYKAYGFCDVLPKPYDSAQLEAALQRVFGRDHP